MSPTIGTMRPPRWSVCLIDSEARPARVKRTIITGSPTPEAAMEAANSKEWRANPNTAWAAVSAEEIGWPDSEEKR